MASYLATSPPLTKTTVISNYLLALLYPEAVDKYLTNEMAASHVSGPFTLDKVEVAFYRPVILSPLIIAVQP
jgi:hypothetical protein